jgi:uncharacterized protein YjiS (DUF1127 family)
MFATATLASRIEHAECAMLAELARPRRQLTQLDERLLRDIGLDRATARIEATKGFWA